MVLSTPAKKPEELGFYMPDSPFAKVAEASGLDFNADKVRTMSTTTICQSDA